MHATWNSASGLALLIALAAVASAGTPDDPEVTDPTLDAGAGNAWGDIEKAWIEEIDGETLRVHVQLHVLPPTHPGNVVAFLFDADEETFYAAVVHIEQAYFGYGRFDRDSVREQGFESSAGSVTTGPGGVVSVDFPRNALPANVTTLTNLAAITVDIKPGPADGPYVVLDTAEGSRDFTMTAPPAPAQAPSGGAPDDQARPDAATAAGVEEGAPPSPDAEAQRATPAPGILALLAASVAGVLVKARKAR